MSGLDPQRRSDTKGIRHRKSPNTPTRRALLAKIHIAKKDLALTDDGYRAILHQATDGKHQSSAYMTISELHQVIAVFKSYGWKPKPKPKRKQLPPSHQAQIRAVFGLWAECCDYGVFDTRDRTATQKWIRNNFGVDDPNFLAYEDAINATNRLRKILNDAKNEVRYHATPTGI